MATPKALPKAQAIEQFKTGSNMDLNHAASQALPLLTMFIKALPFIAAYLSLFKWVRGNANLRAGISAMDACYICVGCAAVVWVIK